MIFDVCARFGEKTRYAKFYAHRFSGALFMLPQARV